MSSTFHSSSPMMIFGEGLCGPEKMDVENGVHLPV